VARRKLIVVSNRGPVSFGRDDTGARVAKRGGGGLATALRGLIAHHDVTWIASAMTAEDRAVATERGGSLDETTSAGAPFRLRLLPHDPAVYRSYYDRIANGTLWFLHHYFWGLVWKPDLDDRFRAAWGDYELVNRAFAEAVSGELEREPDSIVWFHDYHLYLAPALVRERHRDARLTHFVHVPWPQSDYWSALPAEQRLAVHEGLCANDVVGFHTERWRRNFVQSCGAIGGTCPATAANPIGIDAAEFDDLARSPGVLVEEERIVASRPESLILRVDRTDPSKNIVRGFRAYGLMLDRHPELHRRVRMLALLDPSRQDVPEYVEYVEWVEREARAVNDRFGDPGWQPVDLRVGDNFQESVAAYKQFDVLLVNAVLDGMNLVAKEAPLVNTRDGVVVLSENAGAHAELGAWTLTVNPFDLEGQAEALYRALTMPLDERRRRIRAISRHVRDHGVETWTSRQLAELDRHTSTIRS
jgi:trehalose 6-phosphate synthase